MRIKSRAVIVLLLCVACVMLLPQTGAKYAESILVTGDLSLTVAQEPTVPEEITEPSTEPIPTESTEAPTEAAESPTEAPTEATEATEAPSAPADAPTEPETVPEPSEAPTEPTE